jgi:hypothetical protein
MKVIGILLVIWLIIGLFASIQRHYYSGAASCNKAGAIVATIAAGPLNYAGANPKITCHVPQPSK